MKRKCSECKYAALGGGYDPCSDICDECRYDGDTGWCGFTDHSVNRHFYSEEEQKQFYEKSDLLDDEFNL